MGRVEEPISKDKKGSYIVVDGTVTRKHIDIFLKEFNKSNNINGEQIKIIVGSTNMIEGVSLFNLREIHIMEPWYNFSRCPSLIIHHYLSFNLVSQGPEFG